MIEFSRPVALADVDRHPVRKRIEASPSERAALAKRLGVSALGRLTADLTVAKRRGAIHVTGSFAAVMDQVCVVTLDPFTTALEGEVDEDFSEQADAADDLEIDIDLETPEPLTEDALDLGELVVQCLALEIDPHPRAPGADLTQLEAPAEAPDEPVHPFAALRKWQSNS
ncbi:MAG: DUF177 domain-containing protein [Alphaproteobacteria bacterium]|nr:DUF177 domain-containing protein [Alphaproteobacteria bacterium]MCB9928840.1 DUF177 domain-containing protein [Alphaproteobacteria bacterium]